MSGAPVAAQFYRSFSRADKKRTNGEVGAMHSNRSSLRTVIQLGVLGPTLLFFGASGCDARAQETPQAPSTVGQVAEDYKIGPDDVLSVTVADAPEFGGKFRVSDAGLLGIPGAPAPIHAEGQTPIELAGSIRQALMDAKQLRDPKVTVFIEEYQGRTITVLGSVSKPAVYALQKRTTVLEAISMGGGALSTAGNTVTIMRGPASAEATNTSVGSVQLLDMSQLMNGENSSANVQVRNGDVVSLSAADIVYVVGAVMKPGGFAMPAPGSGVSVVQAVALAQGVNPMAATHRGVIVRQSTSAHSRVEIPVDIGNMLTGKIEDQLLAPNDILYIPESGTKKTLKSLGDMAMTAATGIAIYGLGYRIGTK